MTLAYDRSSSLIIPKKTFKTDTWLWVLDRHWKQAVSIDDGDGETVFITSPVGIRMNDLSLQIIEDPSQFLRDSTKREIIYGNVLDHGAWSGALGITIAKFAKNIGELLFHDVQQEALQYAMRMSEENGINIHHSNHLWDELFDSAPPLDFCVSNMPQDPNCTYVDCGEWWSELQVRETCRVGKLMQAGWHILTKSVSYSKCITEFTEISNMFDIITLNTEECKNPHTDTQETVTYYFLQKK